MMNGGDDNDDGCVVGANDDVMLHSLVLHLFLKSGITMTHVSKFHSALTSVALSGIHA